MALLDHWKKIAYDETVGSDKLQKIWGSYFAREKDMYQKLLSEPEKYAKGTVKELAEAFGQDIMTMTGFLDGINDSLVEKNPIETMEEDTVVSLEYDMELLYKNMVGADADWLYNLPEWDELTPEDRRKELYKEQKLSTTVVKGPKISRNDPCPCGSGLKYKKCCGR